MKKVLILIAALFISINVNAKTLSPALKLLKVDVISMSEEGGEELFLHVTEYHSSGDSSSKTIPEHPTFWPTEHLANVKNVSVWDGKLSTGESVELLVSLMEKDFHPWNIDDMIGTVKLRLKNEDNKLKVDWSMPNSADKGETINTKFGPGKKFTLVADGSRYVVYLALVR